MVSLQLIFSLLLLYHALYSGVEMAILVEAGICFLMSRSCPRMTGRVYIQEAAGKMEAAQIHRIDETGRFLHCRSSGRASSPARRTGSSTMAASPKLLKLAVRWRCLRYHTAGIQLGGYRSGLPRHSLFMRRNLR